MPRQKSRPSEYLSRVMNEQNLTAREVSRRAREKGFEISDSLIHNLLIGQIGNLRVQSLKALAAGLGRPESEVAAVFGLDVSYVAAPKKHFEKPERVTRIAPPQPTTDSPPESITRRVESVSIAVGLIVSGIILLWPHQLIGAALIAVGVLVVAIVLIKGPKEKK